MQLPNIVSYWLTRTAIISSMLVGTVACEPALELSPETSAMNTAAVRNYVRSLGYTDSMIVDWGNYLLVSKDIAYPKTMAMPPVLVSGARQAYQPNPQEMIYRGSKRVIKVRIDPGLDSYHDEIIAAMTMWNTVDLYRLDNDPVPESAIHFTEVSSSPDLVIRGSSTLPRDVLGIAEPPNPVTGNPGNLLLLNLRPTEFPQESRLSQIATIAHELGHTLGFRHTNWSELGETGAVKIQGTPATDPLSLMNQATTRTRAGLGLTTADRLAIRTMYPVKPYGFSWDSYSLTATLRFKGPLHKVASYTVRYTVKYNDFLLPSKAYTKDVPASSIGNAVITIPFICLCSGVRVSNVTVRVNYVDNVSSAWAAAPSFTP